MEPEAYNRKAAGRLWTLADLPAEWPGAAILRAGDLDQDQTLDGDERAKVDWRQFSFEVGAFQIHALSKGLNIAHDRKLGPRTLQILRKFFDIPNGRPLATVGGVVFRPAEEPTAPPLRSIAGGSNSLERRIVGLWNRYGGEIEEQADPDRYGLPAAAAAAVFAVEAGGLSHSPTTGLVIIRVEVPGRFGNEAAFRSKYGTGQAAEWRALTEWSDTEAAFRQTSWGLAQVMGFNAGLAGYENAMAMAQGFQRSARAQVRGFFRILKNFGLIEVTYREDWRKFARRYNGPGQVEKYSGALAQAMAAAKAVGL